MDDQRFGAVLRAVRARRRLSQADVAHRAGVSQSTVSRIERGHVGSVSVDTLRAVARVLDVRAELDARWRGPDLARLLDARHAALEGVIARTLVDHGWVVTPEVTFNRYGERGSIDLLGWHEATASAVVVEAKTAIVDVQDLLATIDRKRRLAPAICAERRWRARTVGVCVVVLDSRTNRRRVAAAAVLLRAALPDDGRAARRWFHRPEGALAALAFLPSSHVGHAGQRSARQVGALGPR